jgi:hypothetical protein
LFLGLWVCGQRACVVHISTGWRAPRAREWLRELRSLSQNRVKESVLAGGPVNVDELDKCIVDTSDMRSRV